MAADSRSLIDRLGKEILDPIWRIKNLYTIVTDDGKEIKFDPNEEQLAFLYGLWTRNLILKARQLGFTTEICILELDQAMFNANFSAGVIAHKIEDAEKIFYNKILTPYQRLPEALHAIAPIIKRTEASIRFANNSQISVGTSMRSGTLQFLHVSEFGKICRQYPAKAREIVTGSFEAVSSDCIIVVESTAEGNDGYFHDYCIDALKLAQEGVPLTKLDWRLHFFPWWTKKSNVLDPSNVVIPAELKHYFQRLEGEHQIFLSPEQRAWYAKKKETLKGDMHREHPSYPEEAFEQSIEGAIYGKTMAWLRTNGRITSVPFDPSVPVNTFWDLGVNDTNAIWFHQAIGPRNHFIRYYENSGEGLAHYWNEINKYATDEGWTLGEHYLPHDADYRLQGEVVQTKADILRKLGMRNIVIVPRTPDLNAAIDLTRTSLQTVWIDRENCEVGIKCLDNYQREWDETLGRWRQKPLHNWASNGADAIRQFAQGYRIKATAGASGASWRDKLKSRRRGSAQAA